MTMPAPNLEGLHPLGGRIPLAEYLRQLWARRDYAVEIPRSELRAQHLHTVLGNLWLLLNPLLQVGVYYAVFGLLLRTDRGTQHFISFLAVGVFTYHYSQRSISSGSRAIVRNEGLIRSIRFPRALLVISSIVSQAIAYVPVVVVMLLVATAQTRTLRWTMLLLPALFVAQTLFNLGGAFFAARVNTVFRDLEDLLPFLFRLMLYMSGVMYSVTAFVSNPTILKLFALNPFFCFIEVARWMVLGLAPAPYVWTSMFVWSAVLPVTGFLFFRGGEESYGRA